MQAQVPPEVMGDPRFNINLFHINADETVRAIRHLGEEVLQGRYNIGYWAWELPDIERPVEVRAGGVATPEIAIGATPAAPRDAP